MNWEDVNINWQIAFTEAWNAYIGNTFPIGAAVINQKQELIAVGRNTIYENEQSDYPICYHQLGHAELNALLRVNKHEHENLTSYTLYSTFEPCLSCFGAFVMSRVKHLKFAAKDSFAGATDVKDSHQYIEQRGLVIEGPFPEYEDFQMILLGEFIFRVLPRDIPRVIPSWKKDYSKSIALAEKLANSQKFKKLKDEGASVRKVWQLIQDLRQSIVR